MLIVKGGQEALREMRVLHPSLKSTSRIICFGPSNIESGYPQLTTLCRRRVSENEQLETATEKFNAAQLCGLCGVVVQYPMTLMPSLALCRSLMCPLQTKSLRATKSMAPKLEKPERM